MRILAIVVLIACSVLVSGCSITQTVEPVAEMDTNEVCIINDPEVREGFRPELEAVLKEKNADLRLLEPDASPSDCPVVVTYTARWSWDLSIYMSYVEILVYRDGVPSGKAVYDATKGGGNMSKFIDAEPKIRELVNELFPNTLPDG